MLNFAYLLKDTYDALRDSLTNVYDSRLHCEKAKLQPIIGQFLPHAHNR